MIAKYPKTIALAIGLVSATGFAPLNLWPLTLVCFALLIDLIAKAPDRRAAFLRGWIFGVGHFTVGNNWIAHAFTFQDAMPHWFGYGAVVLLSLYLAVYPALGTLGTWWLWRKLGKKPVQMPLVFAALWIVTEYLRGTVFTGFAWNPLGVIWIPVPPISRLATIIGTYGLSGVSALIAGLIWEYSHPWFNGLKKGWVEGTWLTYLIGGPVLLAAFIFGISSSWLTIFEMTPANRSTSTNIAVRVVQPNIGQDTKYDPDLETRHFLTLERLSGVASAKPRLIFWPEAAVPAYLDMEPEWTARIASILGPNDLLLLGATKVYFKEEAHDLYTARALAGANNSLWVVTPKAELVGRYDKSHLVPYGEYLPMRPILSAIGLSRLVPGDVDFWPGPGPRSLNLPAAGGRPALKMGGQICYEIIFSGQVIDKANRPDFLFNPSNDAWFGSWGPPQHLAQARLRAIEEAMPIIRSTPTGISAVVDAQGNILHSIPHEREGFIDAVLPKSAQPTLFSRLGNWASGLFALLLLALAVAMRHAKN